MAIAYIYIYMCVCVCDRILENRRTIWTQEPKSIFCLYMIGTLMHYPETPSTRQ